LSLGGVCGIVVQVMRWIYGGWKGRRLWSARWLVLLVAVSCAVFAVALSYAAGNGSSGGAPAWGSPSAKALRKVSLIDGVQSEPNFLHNLDCATATYRMVNSGVMQTGCFTRTAFGMIDSDSDTVIFNGTDEAVSLLSYSPHAVLAPWPSALDLVVLDSVNTGGSYISMYRNPLAALPDLNNPFNQSSSKQLAAPPDLVLHDPSGQPLVVNAQTLAFSAGGSWLVAETLNGSFVRFNLATLSMLPFAPAFGSQGSPALLKSQVAVSDNGRYVAIENEAAASFKVYDLTTCNGSTSAHLQPQSCQSYDYQSFVGQQIAGLQSIRHVRFVNDGLLSFKATATNSGSDGTYELAPTDGITSLTDYVGLGDSYTAGEGAFDYLAGTDTSDNMCHLSTNSYPLLLTHDLFGAAGGHSVACSGAVINDIGSLSGSYRGQVKGVSSQGQLEQSDPDLWGSITSSFLPGYIAQQSFVEQYQPGVVTVSVGGNDIGFGAILQNCVAPHLSLRSGGQTCYSTYEDRAELEALINRTLPRWTALYKQLLAEAPGMQLYVIGYPQIFSANGNCSLNVHLNKSELEFAQALIDYLNDTIRQAAVAAGVPYVDIGQALAGHRLCEAASYDVAVNGLTAGTDSGVFGLRLLGKESYHPNALGQALIEQAILKQTHNLRVNTGSGTPPTSDNLIQAPKSGRAINVLVPSDNLVNPVIAAGSSSPLTISSAASGSVRNASYTVSLDGVGAAKIATLVSDNNGDVSGTITLPSTTSPGGHTVDVTGSNQAGQRIDITQPIYVPANSSDADGDGIPDTLDSCPGVVNSGHDDDQDGVDDVCDALIGLPGSRAPQNGSGGGGGSGSQTTSNTLAPGSNSNQNTPVQGGGAEAPAATIVTVQPANGYTDDSLANSGSLPLLVGSGTSSTNSSVVVAAFSVNGAGSQVRMSGRVGGQRPAAAVLGVRTTKPSVTVAQVALLSPHASHAGSHYPNLKAIYWLPGTCLYILLVLVLWFAWLISRLHTFNILTGRTEHSLPSGRSWIKSLLESDSLFYNRLMVWLRKGIVHLLSLVLLLSLLGMAFATSATKTLTHPAKIETLLSQSKLYDAFINNALKQAQQSDSTGAAGSISLDNPTVQQAARAAFTPQLLQNDVNTFLTSNYAWLEGKTSKPAFTIDLTAPKQNFANQVGKDVETRLASLPVCSVAQLQQLQNTPQLDPLSVTCRPPNLNPSAEGALVTDQLNNNSSFIKTKNITADSSNLNPSGQSQPYYQKFSKAPKLYQLAVKLPWVYAGAAVLSTVGIIFIATRRRKGLRRVAIVLTEAGILLVATKFIADTAFKRLEKKLFNSSSVGQLQQSLTDFLHRLETQLVRIDLWFGIAFLALAVLLFALLWFTRDRNRANADDSSAQSKDGTTSTQTMDKSAPLPNLKPRSKPKPPRLIQ